jgi:hypothetical protein
MGARKIWLLAVLVTGFAVADEPKPATPAPPPTAATKADAPEPAASEAKQEQTPAKSVAVEGELDQDKIMAAQKAGYEIRNENGETLLCRKELKTGSRLRHTVSCLTPRKWEQLHSDTAHTLRAIERRRVGTNAN